MRYDLGRGAGGIRREGIVCVLVVGKKATETPSVVSESAPNDVTEIPKTDDGFPDYESLMQMGEECDSDSVEIVGATMEGVCCAAGASVLVDSEDEDDSEEIEPISAVKSGQKRAALVVRALHAKTPKDPKEKKARAPRKPRTKKTKPSKAKAASEEPNAAAAASSNQTPKIKEQPKDRRAEQRGLGGCVVLFIFEMLFPMRTST